MITINMMCIPQGIGMLRFDILTGSIWTTDCGKFHAYHLEMEDGTIHSGRFEKTFSGHSNPFQLLAAIYEDINKND